MRAIYHHTRHASPTILRIHHVNTLMKQTIRSMTKSRVTRLHPRQKTRNTCELNVLMQTDSIRIKVSQMHPLRPIPSILHAMKTEDSHIHGYMWTGRADVTTDMMNVTVMSQTHPRQTARHTVDVWTVLIGRRTFCLLLLVMNHDFTGISIVLILWLIIMVNVIHYNNI